MKKELTLLLLIIPFLNLFAQDSPAIKNNKTYISLKHYKKMYKSEITKQDSLNFKYRDNDTLILVNSYKVPVGSSVPYEERDSIFLNLYKDIVFQKSSKKRSDEKKHTIKYWKNDIQLYFDKSVNKKFKNKILFIAEKISLNVDSLTIYETKNKDQSNYFIYELNKKNNYKYDTKINGTDGCDFFITWDGRQRLYKCTLEINSLIMFNEKLMIRSLKKDFIKSLGFFKETEKLNCESVFSNCYNNSNSFITELDLEILKYHYSYGICKGTDLETFEGQHKRAKESLKKGDTMNFFHSEE